MPGAVTGAVMAAYFVGFGAGSLRANHLIQAVGHIRAFATFGATLAAVAIAHSLMPSVVAWLLLRLLGGFCVAGLFMVVESWLNATSAPERRGQVLSVYMVTVFLALAAGQGLFSAEAAVAAKGGTLFGLSALLVSLAVVPVAATRMAAPEPAPSAAISTAELARRAPLGVATSFVGGVMAGGIYGIGPVFASTTRLPVGGVATFMSLTILGGLALQLPIGRLSDHIDRRKVLAGAALALAAVGAGLPLLGRLSQPACLALAALFGGLALALYPVGVAHVFDRLDRSQALPAMRSVLFVYAVGSTAGPLATALAVERFGDAGFHGLLGAVALGLGLYALRRIRHVQAVPAQERAVFLPLSRTTAAIADLDPRTDAEPPAPSAGAALG